MPPPDVFSKEALDAQLRKLPDLPAEQGGVGVVAKAGDVGVEGSINKRLGNGWFVEGDGSWMKRAGYTVSGWLGWKGKPK